MSHDPNPYSVPTHIARSTEDNFFTFEVSSGPVSVEIIKAELQKASPQKKNFSNVLIWGVLLALAFSSGFDATFRFMLGLAAFVSLGRILLLIQLNRYRRKHLAAKLSYDREFQFSGEFKSDLLYCRSGNFECYCNPAIFAQLTEVPSGLLLPIPLLSSYVGVPILTINVAQGGSHKDLLSTLKQSAATANFRRELLVAPNLISTPLGEVLHRYRDTVRFKDLEPSHAADVRMLINEFRINVAWIVTLIGCIGLYFLLHDSYLIVFALMLFAILFLRRILSRDSIQLLFLRNPILTPIEMTFLQSGLDIRTSSIHAKFAYDRLLGYRLGNKREVWLHLDSSQHPTAAFEPAMFDSNEKFAQVLSQVQAHCRKLGDEPTELSERSPVAT